MLYGWGQGTGFNESRINPIGIEYANEISAGSCHNYCLNKDGVVFAWGLNANGGLGFEVEHDVSVTDPQPIETLK